MIVVNACAQRLLVPSLCPWSVMHVGCGASWAKKKLKKMLIFGFMLSAKTGSTKKNRKNKISFRHYWVLQQNFAKIKFKIPYAKFRIRK